MEDDFNEFIQKRKLSYTLGFDGVSGDASSSLDVWSSGLPGILDGGDVFFRMEPSVVLGVGGVIESSPYYDTLLDFVLEEMSVGGRGLCVSVVCRMYGSGDFKDRVVEMVGGKTDVCVVCVSDRDCGLYDMSVFGVNPGWFVDELQSLGVFGCRRLLVRSNGNVVPVAFVDCMRDVFSVVEFV